jgi:hypothetical protein
MQHVDVVLHKPFAPTALVEQIERLVSPPRNRETN